MIRFFSLVLRRERENQKQEKKEKKYLIKSGSIRIVVVVVILIIDHNSFISGPLYICPMAVIVLVHTGLCVPMAESIYTL